MEKPESMDLDSIDLLVYLKMLQKWKWLVAGITLLAVITAGVLSFFVLSPVYQSKTLIMVKQYQDPKATTNNEEQQTDNLQSVVNSLSRLPEMTIKSYVEQVKNEGLLRKIIDVLKLDKTIYYPDSLGDLIDVEAVPETNLIQISVKNNDSGLAAKIANRLAEEFVKFVGSTNDKQLSNSTKYISDQLAAKNKELDKATAELNNFRNQVRNKTFVQQELQIKNNNLAENKALVLELGGNIQQLQAGLTTAQERLKDTPEKIKVVKIDITMGNKPMDTEELNPARADLETDINRKSIAIAESQIRLQNAQTAVNQLQTEVKNLQVELNAKQQMEAQLTEKWEQIKHTRDVLADKLIQVQLAKSVNLGETGLQIVTPAFPQDKPISPRKALNMAIALILGFMVSVMIVLVLEFTNNTINKQEDIDQHLGLPVLGMIPLARGEDLK